MSQVIARLNRKDCSAVVRNLAPKTPERGFLLRWSDSADGFSLYRHFSRYFARAIRVY